MIEKILFILIATVAIASAGIGAAMISCVVIDKLDKRKARKQMQRMERAAQSVKSMLMEHKSGKVAA